MKRFLAFLLAVMLVLSLIACTQENTSTPTDSSNNVPLDSSQAATPGEEISFPLAEPQTISMMAKTEAIDTVAMGDKIINERLFEATNVNVEWTTYVADQFVERRNLALANPDTLPNVLWTAEFSHLDILNYAEDGTIIPLNDMINNYMPNLRSILDTYPDIENMLTAPDGNIYSLPWIEQLGVGKEAIQAIGGLPFINKAWLDELNLPVPTTTEELEEALVAFQGMGENVIPMSFRINGWNEGLYFILGAFGYGDNPDHIMIDENNQVVYSLTDEGYKEGIMWLNSLYDQGLIDPEAFTHDFATYVAKGRNDQYGLFFGWDAGSVAAIPDEFVPLPALEGPDGWKNAPRQNGTEYGGFQVGRTVVTVTATDKQELVGRYLDLMYDPMQSIENNWGTYDDPDNTNVFSMTDDGVLQREDLGDLSEWEVRVKQMTGGPLALLDEYFGVYVHNDVIGKEPLPPRMEPFIDDMVYDMVYPQLFVSIEDAERMAQLETDINTYGQEKKADWILNGGIEEEWDDYLVKMEDYGLSEYIEIKQKYLDDYLG